MAVTGCRGICEQYRAKLLNGPMRTMGRYAAGQKRCSRCEMWMWYGGLWCPCCGNKLKTKPYSSKNKERLRQILDAREAAQCRPA